MANMKLTRENIDRLPRDRRAEYRDERVRGLVLRVGARDRVWYLRRKVDGQTIRARIGPYPEFPPEAARRKAEEMAGSLARGEDPRTRRRGTPTVKELFEKFVDLHAKEHKKTWEEDQRVFDTLLKTVHRRKVVDLRPLELQQLHSRLGRDNGHIAANRALILLHAVYQFGIKGDMVKINPVAVKYFREEARERFLLPDELPRFFAQLGEEHPMIASIILALLYTGARKANVLQMRWDEIDANLSAWTIPKEKTKSRRTYEIALPRQLRPRLAKWHDEWVFPGRKGHYKSIHHPWPKFCAAAGLEGLRVHDLRRTLASYLNETGAQPYLIKDILCHRAKDVTGIYARSHIDARREAMEKAIAHMITLGQTHPNVGKVMTLPA